MSAKENNFCKSKINLIITAIFIVVAIVGLILLIPAVQNIGIKIGEALADRELRNYDKWHKVMMRGGVMLLIADIAVTVLYFLDKKFNFVEKIKKLIILVKEKQIKYIKENLIFCDIKIYIKPFLILFALYLLAFSSIIRANFNYMDDNQRTITGLAFDNAWSRHISHHLSHTIHGSKYLYDISPLTQIIAIVFLSLSSLSLIYIFNKKNTIKISPIIASLIIGTTPYFLQCFSYKYDSPYMALSVLSDIFPFLFINKNEEKFGKIDIPYIIASICGILIVCMTYQAASGIFPMITLFLCMRKWNENYKLKDIFTFLAISIVAYLTGLLIYKYFLMAPISLYASNSLPPINKMFSVATSNLRRYFSLINSDFIKTWKVLIFINLLLFIFINAKTSKKNKIASIVVSIGIIFLAAILMFGMYIILEKPLFDMRAMYGFGIFISVVSLINVSQTKTCIPKITTFALCYLFIVFSLGYGNSLSEAQRWNRFRLQLLVDDLSETVDFETEKLLQIKGYMSYSPAYDGIFQRYNLLKKLTMPSFGEWYYLKYVEMKHYFGVKNFKEDDSINLKEMNLPVLKNTMYHIIYGNENYILIELK